MVSFAAIAAEESNTQKLDNILSKGKEDSKNVMIVVTGKPQTGKVVDRKKMNDELRELFAKGRNGSIKRNELVKKMREVRSKYSNKHEVQLDLSFLKSDSFKEYKKDNLLSLNIVVDNVKDLPDKIKNNFEVKSIPTVILVNKDSKVVHRLVSGKRGSKRIPTAYIIGEYKLINSK